MEQKHNPHKAFIRLMQKQDQPLMHTIYSWYVENTPWNLDWTPESQEDFSRRIEKIEKDWPVYCAMDGQGNIMGYGYAHQVLEKQAYEHVAELTMYFREGPHFGLPAEMLQKLEEDLKKQNIRWMISCITQANRASVAFHDRHGFSFLGRLPHAGYKNHCWYDVVWYGKDLQPEAPAGLCREDIPRWRSFGELRQEEEGQENS